MAEPDLNQVTIYLQQMQDGDSSAVERLLPHVYQDLRRLAEQMFRDQRQCHTLQPTALVHEAYVRLVAAEGASWESKRHFLRVAARAMRQLLTDYARRKGAAKRFGGKQRVVLEEVDQAGSSSDVDLLALDEALDELGKLDERQAQIVELRFLTGLTIQETADVLEVSERTISFEWTMARSWLERRLSEA